MGEVTFNKRCIAALITGEVLHALIFHPSLPCSVRERHLPGAWAMAAFLALAGLVLTYGLKERHHLGGLASF
jgi:hypothetical protein